MKKTKEYKYLTEKNLQDGQEIQRLYNSLDEETKKQANIYLSALSDRCKFVGNKIA